MLCALYAAWHPSVLHIYTLTNKHQSAFRKLDKKNNTRNEQTHSPLQAICIYAIVRARFASVLFQLLIFCLL